MNTNQCACVSVLAAIAGSSLARPARAQLDEPFPNTLELSGLLPTNGGDGSIGFVINGINKNDASGGQLSSAGDVNGDGIDDLIISAYRASADDRVNAGESYVVFGAPGVGAGGSIDLSSLDGSNGFVIRGIDPSDFSGGSVASVGDLNNDGFADLAIGANRADPHGSDRAGETYVIFGGFDVGSSGVLELSSLDGSNGFVINGITPGDRSGTSVSSAGDLNADGIDDLLLSAPAADPNGLFSAGSTYVIFGAAGLGSTGSMDLSSLDGTNGFVINGAGQNDYSGFNVSAAGDVNGDSIGDILIGGLWGLYILDSGPGAVHVVFGAAGLGAGGTLELSSLDGANGFALESLGDDSSPAVSTAGDVNGDGVDDLMVGTSNASPNGLYSAGECFVVFGSSDLGAGGLVKMSALDGNNGFTIRGTHAGDQLGASVAPAGDVNSDGLDDLVVSASSVNVNGFSQAGQCYVLFGAPGIGSGGEVDPATLNGTRGVTFNGFGLRHRIRAARAGDINNDGIEDLLFGAPTAVANGVESAGQSYVVFGRSPGACPPDLNRDGVIDLGDIEIFVRLYLDESLSVDLNADGTINPGDIGAFIAAFLAGC